MSRISFLTLFLFLTILFVRAKCQVDFQTKNPTCFGSNDGYIEIITDIEDYIKIEWNNGDTTWRIENLFGGTYSCRIYEKNGVVLERQIVLKRPTPLSFGIKTIHFDDQSMGSIEVYTTGGTGEYSYIWSNNESGACIYNLYPGEYSLEVFDSNSCSLDANITIRNHSDMLLSNEYHFD